MAKDLFGNLGGLGGLVKGLSGFMPQDDPDVQMIQAQSELSDLTEQETKIYVQIGKQALQKYGNQEFGELAEELKLIQGNIIKAEEKIDEIKGVQKEAEEQKRLEDEKRTCPNCGAYNEEGVNFCQECGTKLGVRQKRVCPHCGTQQQEGVKFCGECGGRLGDE